MIAVIVIIGLSLLIIGHELGHFIAAKRFGLKVEEFGIGFPPRLWKRKRGETSYSVGWLPFGGFVRIAGERPEPSRHEVGSFEASEGEKKRLFWTQSAGRKSIIVVAGVLVNIFLGWLFLSLVFMVGTPPVLIVGGVQADSPAALVGMERGDIIRKFTKADEFIAFANANRGREVEISIDRKGETKTFSIIPRAESKPGEGAIGILIEEGGVPRQGFFASLREGFTASFRIMWFTLVAFYELIKGILSQGTLLEGIVGPVGIFGVAVSAGKVGLAYLLQLLGIISLNLAVLNLIPFPALDGGRLLMIAIEKVKGSPVSEKVEAAVNGVGFAFLILLMVLVTARDITQWFS